MGIFIQLRTHHHELDALAQGWLAVGASAFGVRIGGEPVWSWGQRYQTELATIRVPIVIHNTDVAELWVQGEFAFPAESLLSVEAQFVARLINLEQEMSLLTGSLVEMQDQLVGFYKLARFGQQRVPVRMILSQFARRATEMFRVESGFCLVASTEWPLIVEHHPESLLGPQPLHEYLLRIKDGEPLIRWQREENNHNTPSLLTQEINNLILVSVSIHKDGVVALGLVNKGGEGFTVPDIKLAEAYVQNAGAQIENLLLYQQAIEQTKLRAEMDLAHSVQLNLLPQQSPRVEGLDIWANSRSALQVGGDFYDFSWSPSQPFTFTVGDVSGKGLPAAMLMAMTRVILRTIMQLPVAISPEGIISRAHDALYGDFVHVGMFVTVFVGQYNDLNQELSFANAGHSPVIYCPRGGPARLIGAEGMPMGVLRDISAREQHLQIRTGDILVVASDGFHESWNETGEMFGYDRLLALIEASRHYSASEIGHNLFNNVNAFRQTRTQEDDQTVIILKGTK